MSCNICVEDFNTFSRECISCPFCNFQSCKSCWKQFFLSIPEKARCMNDSCKKQWSRKHLISSFDGTFLEKSYKNHVKNILFDIEKSLLPQSQIIVERKLKAQKIEDQMKKIKEKIKKMNVAYNTLKKERASILRPCHNILLNGVVINGETVKKERISFVRQCPNNDCRGFLSPQWNCGLCGIKACKDCHEIIHDDEHKCDPNNLETAKLLEKDTKGCPTCGAMIFKISGCDQMFCTSCNTAFDWKTGRVQKGVIHNPHYFEWMRRNGKNPRTDGDIQCDRGIDHYFILNFSRGMRKKMEFDEDCRRIIHIQHVDMPYLREPVDTSTLREEFLAKKFDEKHFKKMILMKKKKQDLNNEILQVLDMYVNASTDILYRFKDVYRKTGIHWGDSEMYKELEVLKKYKDTCLDEISEVYKTNITKEYKD